MDTQHQIAKANTSLAVTPAEHIGLLHQCPALMQHQHDSSAQMVLDNCLALDYLLAKEGGVCAIKSTTCHTYIKNAGQVQTNVQKMAQGVQEYRNLT